MSHNPKVDQTDAQFKKAQQAKEGQKAMADYQAASAAVREKTSRLRSLRLAKEAAELETASKTKPVGRSKKPSR